MINQNILDYERKLLGTQGEGGVFKVEEVHVGEGKINTTNVGATRNSITFPINGRQKLLEKTSIVPEVEAGIFSNQLLKNSTTRSQLGSIETGEVK